MARTAAFLGAAAILALGGFAALPDDKPQYLGDLPSSLEQPEPPRPPAPRSDPGPAAGGPPPPVQGPSRVVPEAPAGGHGAPGERVPDPTTDTSLDIEAGSTSGDDAAPSPGAPDILAGVTDAVEQLADCAVDGLRTLPSGAILDCVTGLPVPTPPVPVPTLPVPVPVPPLGN